jgi:hypothetical protein
MDGDMPRKGAKMGGFNGLPGNMGEMGDSGEGETGVNGKWESGKGNRKWNVPE